MRRSSASLALLLALAAGCNGRDEANQGANLTVRPVPRASESAPGAPQQLDAEPRQMRFLAVQIYALELPRGRVSENAELWRRIDEQAVAPGIYDVLWSNGVRVGGAKLAELEHIRQTLGIDTAQRVDLQGRGMGRQSREYSIESDIGERTLFWFDAAKRHHGRTFQRCETLLSIAFEPAPGRTDAMRISMTPVVRAMSPRLVVTPAGDDYQVTEMLDTNLLDLNLQADVPFGEFLIVSPSDQMRWETSLGRQFFCGERDGELFERIYILIPQVTAARDAPRH